MTLLHNLKNIDGIKLSPEKDERIIRDNMWVTGINKGDKKAFESMYKCYYSQLFHFLVRYLDSESAIEDIIQHVFYKVWQNRENIEPRGTLKSYLFTSVRNQALKHLEAEKKGRGHDGDITENTLCNAHNPEITLELKELNEAYQEAVEKLPEKRRHIFLMHRQDYLTYKEIAEILNISIKTVETQMRRSLKFLAISLSKYM